MKNLSYLVVLVASAILYFNIPSLIFYIVAIIITLVLFHSDLKIVEQFKLISKWKRVYIVAWLVISVFIVLALYFIANGFQNLCTVETNIQAKNYFTGEIKQFNCGITPWYYEKLPGENKVFPAVIK